MRVLVDTNILVRAAQRNDPLMLTARNAVRCLIYEKHELCITWQIVSEFWNVSTRPIEANGLGNSIATVDRLASRLIDLFTMLPESAVAFRACGNSSSVMKSGELKFMTRNLQPSCRRRE